MMSIGWSFNFFPFVMHFSRYEIGATIGGDFLDSMIFEIGLQLTVSAFTPLVYIDTDKSAKRTGTMDPQPAHHQLITIKCVYLRTITAHRARRIEDQIFAGHVPLFALGFLSFFSCFFFDTYICAICHTHWSNFSSENIKAFVI
jgi:hypothetical protein